jgi:hypothetical protein
VISSPHILTINAANMLILSAGQHTGVVYLLYASRQPESTRSATRGTRVWFAVAIVFFALSPIPAAINTEQSVGGLVSRCSQLVDDPMWVGICP